MHTETMRARANEKIAEELAWAERQRLARLSRSVAEPDEVAVGEPVEHLSFTTRLRTAVGALLHASGRRPTGPGLA